MRTRQILCPKCKGRGHIFDVLALASPIEWFSAWSERDDRSAYSRERCDRCRGSGYIVSNTR